MTEEEICEMISDCIEALESNDEDFTDYEHDFLLSIQEQNEEGHLSEKQQEKLEEIWDEKVPGIY